MFRTVPLGAIANDLVVFGKAHLISPFGNGVGKATKVQFQIKKEQDRGPGIIVGETVFILKALDQRTKLRRKWTKVFSTRTVTGSLSFWFLIVLVIAVLAPHVDLFRG